MPEWLVWEAVICRELCCIFSSNLAVILSSVFSSPAFLNAIKKTWFPSDPCLYHCKAYKELDELQLMVRWSPSRMIRDGGLCCSIWVLTPVQRESAKKTRDRRKILLVIVTLLAFYISRKHHHHINTECLLFFSTQIGSEKGRKDRRWLSALKRPTVDSALSQMKYILTGCLQTQYSHKCLQEHLHPGHVSEHSRVWCLRMGFPSSGYLSSVVWGMAPVRDLTEFLFVQHYTYVTQILFKYCHPLARLRNANRDFCIFNLYMWYKTYVLATQIKNIIKVGSRTRVTWRTSWGVGAVG